LLAAGFGLPDVPAIVSVARGDGICLFLGFPTYGGGSFEQLGIPTTVPLLVGFLLVAVAEVVCGGLLWTRHRAGPVMALALLPVELSFWIGFSLPRGPILGLGRTVLVFLGSGAVAPTEQAEVAAGRPRGHDPRQSRDRTPDLRITRLTRRIADRTTSTRSAPGSTQRTGRPWRTGRRIPQVECSRFY
jgi:hypothetical protein